MKISGLWVFGATGSMAVSKTADRGSNPLSPALYLIYKCFGRVAQERAADINQRVDGASPSSSTLFQLPVKVGHHSFIIICFH